MIISDISIIVFCSNQEKQKQKSRYFVQGSNKVKIISPILIDVMALVIFRLKLVHRMYDKKLNESHVYVLHALIVSGIILGSTSFSFDKQRWAVAVARYLFYVLFIRLSQEAVTFGYKMFGLKQKMDPYLLVQAYKTYLYIFAGVAAILFYNNESLFSEDFLMLFFAYLIAKYLEMGHAPTSIRYGIGMACSFFEGYLALVIPSDGAKFVGFAENIRRYEAHAGVVFPVKVLFIIITKSMYCPPDLMMFNKPNSEGVMPYLEACESLEDVNKDVAGVKNRIYRNSAYKIHRPGLKPVYLSAECATPLHTLHKVLQRRALYEELNNIDIDEVVRDFSNMLRSVIYKSEECRGKCELVYFDNTNPELNLADVLLDKIRELEPNFENISA